MTLHAKQYRSTSTTIVTATVTVTVTATAWAISQAVVRWMTNHGHDAVAVKGPASAAPDDVSTIHCCHVRANAAAWCAFTNRHQPPQPNRRNNAHQ